MKFIQKNINDVIVGYIDGEINLQTVPYLRSVLDKLSETDNDRVILNFLKVGYIDSMGIAAIIAFVQKREKLGKKTGISNIQPKIFSIFRITKLDKVLNIFDSEEDALKSL